MTHDLVKKEGATQQLGDIWKAQVLKYLALGTKISDEPLQSAANEPEEPQRGAGGGAMYADEC